MGSIGKKLALGVLTAAVSLIGVSANAQQKACVGASVPLTGPAAFAGKSTEMGALVAIDEINAAGGVLGQELKYIAYDDAGAPPRGVDNTRRIAQSDKCSIILGGYHSTVGLAQVDAIRQIGMPYIGTFAANTKIVENGDEPEKNLMFRVSGKDKWVAKFLVDEGLKRSANKKIALMYENTGWGNGALPDVIQAMADNGLELVAQETFNWGDQDMGAQIKRIQDADADTVIIWGLDREANQILRSMRKANYKPTILGGWGLAGNLGELAGDLANGVMVMQTFTLTGELNEKSQKLYDALQKKFNIKDPTDIKVYSALGNTYDAMHIAAKAINKAGEFNWEKIHEALCSGIEYDGLLNNYSPAFTCDTTDGHDALRPENYIITVWDNGALLPLEQTDYK